MLYPNTATAAASPTATHTLATTPLVCVSALLGAGRPGGSALPTGLISNCSDSAKTTGEGGASGRMW